jgi:UDP:flavonoid glycosyltransferase YjiC (YdhE family)
MWGRLNSFQVVMEKGVTPGLRPTYDLVCDFVSRGDAIVAGSSLAMGMRIAEDKLKIPMSLVHLSPAIVRTRYDVPRLPGVPMRPWMPIWVKDAFYWIADKLMIDRVLRKPIDGVRRDVGLPPVEGTMWNWWNGSQRLIGLWPEWFGPRQPDCPANLSLAGFPLYDEKERRPMERELLRFLEDGDPPIAFTAGSAMWSEHHFFDESASACQRIGCRGLLLTRHREMVPATLPANVQNVPYAPFGQLFPRCSVAVHHGGIGTTAQALASGVRQIVMPFAHDQLDNANRVVKLGVGRWIEPRAYRAKNVANVITEMLANGAMRNRCGEVKRKFTGVDGVAEACELIESMSSTPAAAIA